MPQLNPRQCNFRTTHAAFFAAACLLAQSGPAAAGDSIPEVVALVDTGHFRDAEARIAGSLGEAGLPSAEREGLEFQRERMRRILLDFTLSETEARALVREQIPDLRESEFAAWDSQGLLEHRLIDGRRLYFNRAPSNLFRLSPAAVARRRNAPDWSASPLESAHPHHREVIDESNASDRVNVAPRRVRVTQAITVNKGTVPAGETVRAWIPFPRSIRGQQENIVLLDSTPAKREVAPESTWQRTVYLEQPASAGAPMKFSITYELTIFAQYHAMDAERVVAAQITPELAPFVAERPPHIVFTDDLRKFSREAVGDERNPYRIAQKLFAHVDRIPWAGALEYSTITNISDYALHAGHADCGQQTLLLMTLLRLNGIPARWQSGMMFYENGYDNLHDWGQLYLAPYGWVPMDVTFGRLQSGDPAVAGFYLGGLDAYRIAFNDDYGQPFVPAKQFVRSETVDLQRGEVEWRGGNLYFDRWDYSFDAQVLRNEKSSGGER